MVYRTFSSLFGLSVALGTLLAISIVASSASAASTKAAGNPFDQLEGYWRGGGTLTPMNGKPEKISCRVTYNVAGSAVTQTMNCAGTDYKVNTTSKFTYSGGKISGSWNESTYSATGGVSGTAKGNTVHARIAGDKFSGRMSISVSGKGHTINIVQFDQGSGAYRPVANVSLRR
jgi:hypothetical protein